MICSLIRGSLWVLRRLASWKCNLLGIPSRFIFFEEEEFHSSRVADWRSIERNLVLVRGELASSAEFCDGVSENTPSATR